MFRFKEFSISQDRTAMKVGTDGVLLGAWASLCGEERRILDIGSGTGLITLMMAQRTQHRSDRVVVDGVEVDDASYGQSRENVADSAWGDRVSMHHSDIQNYEAERYDLIVSNPPFFVDSLLAPNAERSNARHTTLLPFSELITAVERLLTDNGRFALILPTTEQQMFDNELRGRLTLLRRCSVRGGVSTPAKRQLSEYTIAKSSAAARHEEITLRNADGEFSEEYRRLTSDFYLKF